jgi:HK97 family phage prohead protease
MQPLRAEFVNRTGMNEGEFSMRFYCPIAKIDGEQRMVWGYASTEIEDEQGETVTRDALAAALDDYMRFANIREMHQPSAVGIAREAAVDDKGLYLGAKIVDDDAWAKVVEGVYKGFSIGGRVTARDPMDRRVIIGLSLTEISVVDRPANPEAVSIAGSAPAGQPPICRSTAMPIRARSAITPIPVTGRTARNATRSIPSGMSALPGPSSISRTTPAAIPRRSSIASRLASLPPGGR